MLPEFSPYVVTRVQRVAAVAAEQAEVHLVATDELLARHERAGQFCRLRTGGSTGIFALMSSPRERALRFLVRTGNPDGGEAADRLALLAPGESVELSLPAGAGFALELARGSDVCFVATGTAIAPVRAALEVVLEERALYGELSLDYGVRTLDHVAVQGDLARWRAAGVGVHVLVADGSPSSTPGAVFVQDALLARRPDLRGAMIVAAGHLEMLRDLGDALARTAGRERLLLNY